MDFNELKAFLELSSSLHFAKAARAVNLSASALSRIISRLENETGAVLFERNNREVKLTDEGRRFTEFARDCISRQQELFSSFSNVSSGVHGVLHVYASVTACYTIMPPFIRRLNALYPAVQLSVETGDPAGAAGAVREGRAELAVAAIPDTKIDLFDCIPVRTSPLVFAASSPGPYVEVSGSPQDIVSSVPLILPKAGLARRRFDSWVKSRNVRPVIAAETEGNEAVMALAALGLGIGLVPKIVLENGPYREGFVCHSAGNALGYYNIGFIQLAKISGTETHRALREAVSSVLHGGGWENSGNDSEMPFSGV
ncbi:MAG TPA: HTH-type transcriptional activator IlvY [Treponema sp.]|nr:HTH-type transcriptional activator IlvY [Treponema sp.]